MKKTFRSLAALAVVMFAGCVNDLTNEVVEPSGKTTVTVGIADTKTYLGDLENDRRKVYWSENDQISINGVASSSVVLSEDKRSATFTFDDPELTRPFSVLYPAEMFKDAKTITLPAVQAAANNTFAVDAAPMATYQAEAGNITLHHIAGVVRLQVKLPAESGHAYHPLNTVEFRGKAQEQVSGDFRIDYQEQTLVGISDAEADKVVTAKSGKTLSTEMAQEVFIVVPARRYEQGFKVRLIDAVGHYMDVHTNDITLARGEIKSMPPLEFKPTGTLVGVEIENAEQMVAFAKAYNEGEYESEEMLNVRLTKDIVFDDQTNAEWEMIGDSGIDNWFRGTFDGQGHSIKNWSSSRPLFYATHSKAFVENITLDESCTFTAPYSEDPYYGSFVGYHTGVLRNCHNNASVTVSGTWAGENGANVGGLVGRNQSGVIYGCSVSGDITADATFCVEGTTYLGGLAGCIATSAGSIQSSHFKGNLTTNGGSVAAKINYIGGITGLAGGEVSNCTTAAEKTVSADYATENTYAVTMYLGGIAGNVKEGGSASDNVNNASVYFHSPKPATSATAYIGGITGYIAKSVSLKGCDNNNSVQSVSDYQNVYLGGVLGAADQTAALVDDCHNLTDGKVTASKYNSGMEYLYMGGVIGRCYISSVSNISNAATIKTENIAAKGANVGGCVGFLDASINGGNTISNSGAVTASGESTMSTYLAQGGVVGTLFAASGTLSYVKNTGAVSDEITVVHKHVFSGGVVGLVRKAATVDNVTNEGPVSFTNVLQLYHENVALAGVVGGISALKNDNFAVKVTNSTNSGTVSRAGKSGVALQRSAMVLGGVVGILKGAGSSVEGCFNYGLVKNEGLNSTSIDVEMDPITAYVDRNSGGSAHTAGGVVGYAHGADDGAVTVSGCTNEGECYAARGYVGGIAGYVWNTVISGSYQNKNVTSVDYNTRTGGVVGYLYTASVKDCDVTATIDGGLRAVVGGICGGMNGTSSIESSTVNGTIKYTSGGAGAIVKASSSGATITKCGAKGSINETQITLSHFDKDGNATQNGSYLID